MEHEDRDKVLVRRVERRPGIRLARIRGIDVHLDPSLLVVFVLVVFGVGTGVLPTWHPDWTPALRWGVAVLAGVLFFGSVVLHELAHALVATLNGIPVPRITLFLFGGVSELQAEPKTPGGEFAIAIVGPITSLLIGGACLLAASMLAGPGFTEAAQADPEAAISALDPATTLLMWLGPINLMLGLFNLLPGFPLDGGRVLRAMLWKATGDVVSATRWAALGGQIVAWLFIAYGLVQVLGGSFGGLWLVLIGWFLNSAARRSAADMVVRSALENLRVRDLMRTRFDQVPPDLPLTRFIDEHLLRGAQTAWPVVDGERPVGLVTFEEVVAIPADRRGELVVRDVMGPLQPLDPGQQGQEALDAVVRAPQDVLAVVEGQRVVGLLHRGDILRWLAVHPTEQAA